MNLCPFSRFIMNLRIHFLLQHLSIFSHNEKLSCSKQLFNKYSLFLVLCVCPTPKNFSLASLTLRHQWSRNEETQVNLYFVIYVMQQHIKQLLNEVEQDMRNY